MTKYNEDKIGTGIKSIQKLSQDLNQENNEELREQLWKLQREATLLMEFVNSKIYEEEDLRQAM